MNDVDYDELVKEVWDSLPDTSEMMASYFARQGVTGVRKDPCICAVANYVRSMLNLPDNVRVVVAGTAMGIEREDDLGNALEGDYYSVPEHVQKFITEFDSGLWPGLEQT